MVSPLSSSIELVGLDASSRYSDSLPPISSLPPEILARVFAIRASEDPPQMQQAIGAKERVFDPGWMVLVRVCRHWRDVAYSSPDLWNFVDCDVSIEWAEYMLSRAKMAPVIIRSSGISSRTTRMIVGNMHHTKELRLDIGLPIDLAELFHGLKAPAPLLETASISVTTQLSLPSNLFGTSAPRLRQLHVSNLSIPWTSPILSNLVVLHISIGGVSFGSSQSPGEALHSILDALGHMHALQSFEYKCRSALSRQEGRIPRRRTIDLPRLHHLALKCSMVDCADILHSLNMPRHTELILVVFGAASIEDGYKALVDAIAAHPIDDVPLSIRWSINFGGLDFEVRRCAPWPPLLQHTFGAADGDSGHLRITVPNAQETTAILPDTLHRLLRACSSHPVKTMTVTSSLSTTAAKWMGSIGRMIQLETLSINTPSIPGLLRAMSMPIDSVGDDASAVLTSVAADPPQDEPHRLFLPRLSKLVLGGSLDLEQEFTIDGERVSQFQLLVRVLSERKAAGSALQELVLLDCRVFHSWVEILEAYVTTLTMGKKFPQ